MGRVWWSWTAVLLCVAGCAEIDAESAGPAPARAISPGCRGGAWLLENVDRGRYLKLQDGTLWEVDDRDRMKALLWRRGDELEVCERAGGTIVGRLADGARVRTYRSSGLPEPR